ncbi:MAG: histidine kinase [Methyloglobulus sp.]|nr:histidine kinase [Methyloglobulus sp.]
MSLSYQINLKILLSSLLILFLGGAIAIWQARGSVDRELASSVNLTEHLIICGLSQTIPDRATWLNCLSSLKETRHLSIGIMTPSGQIFGIGNNNKTHDSVESPPQWFINLIGSKQATTVKQVTTSSGEQFSLQIRANPIDEIQEVWEESLTFFCIILLLSLLTFLSVYFAIHKTIVSIKTIVETLQQIETGNYPQQLPEFSTSEYNSIAKAVNHMTGELYKMQQENRALVKHSMEILEIERKQLAQELHDELGQSLTAIKMMAVIANQKNEQIAEISASIAKSCDGLINIVRSIMHRLHPLVLTELGLKAAIEDLLNHWSSKNPEIKFRFRCDDEVDTLGQKLSIHIFRVVQECLTNIFRHAEAQECSVTLAMVETPEYQIRLTVTDNGKGCDINKLTKGFGILGMKERVYSLGGNLSIQSTLNKGVQVNAVIPIIVK